MVAMSNDAGVLTTNEELSIYSGLPTCVHTVNISHWYIAQHTNSKNELVPKTW